LHEGFHKPPNMKILQHHPAADTDINIWPSNFYQSRLTVQQFFKKIRHPMQDSNPKKGRWWASTDLIHSGINMYKIFVWSKSSNTVFSRSGCLCQVKLISF
jgi:hypothetical protein